MTVVEVIGWVKLPSPSIVPAKNGLEGISCRWSPYSGDLVIWNATAWQRYVPGRGWGTVTHWSPAVIDIGTNGVSHTFNNRIQIITNQSSNSQVFVATEGTDGGLAGNIPIGYSFHVIDGVHDHSITAWALRSAFPLFNRWHPEMVFWPATPGSDLSTIFLGFDFGTAQPRIAILSDLSRGQYCAQVGGASGSGTWSGAGPGLLGSVYGAPPGYVVQDYYNPSNPLAVVDFANLSLGDLIGCTLKTKDIPGATIWQMPAKLRNYVAGTNTDYLHVSGSGPALPSSQLGGFTAERMSLTISPGAYANVSHGTADYFASMIRNSGTSATYVPFFGNIAGLPIDVNSPDGLTLPYTIGLLNGTPYLLDQASPAPNFYSLAVMETDFSPFGTVNWTWPYPSAGIP